MIQNYIGKVVVGNPVRIRNCPATVEGVLWLQAFHKGAAGRGTESECHLLSVFLKYKLTRHEFRCIEKYQRGGWYFLIHRFHMRLFCVSFFYDYHNWLLSEGCFHERISEKLQGEIKAGGNRRIVFRYCGNQICGRSSRDTDQ